MRATDKLNRWYDNVMLDWNDDYSIAQRAYMLGRRHMAAEMRCNVVGKMDTTIRMDGEWDDAAEPHYPLPAAGPEGESE